MKVINYIGQSKQMYKGIGILLFSIALQAEALELYPGVYRKQIFNEPVVLCKAGYYEFNQCDFTIFDCDTGLRIHKGSEVLVNACMFMGWGKEGNGGVGVFTESTLQVKNSYLSGLKYGIFYSGASGPPDTDGNPSNDEDIKMNHFEGLDVGILKTGQGKLSVRLNRFTNNLIGVQLENGLPTGGAQIGVPIQLNFRCNEFVDNAFPLQVQRVGLKVAANAAMEDVGNEFPSGSGLGSPNANVFPVVDRTLPFSHWQSPEGWFSIFDQSESGGWSYFRYNNEFIGNYTQNVAVTIPPSRFVRLSDTDPLPNPDPNQVDEACGDIFETNTPFPARPANPAVTGSQKQTGQYPLLADAIPNPAQDRVRFEFYVPEGNSLAYLDVANTAGQSLKRIGVIGKGSGSVSISVNDLPSGLYQYRLVVNQIPLPWKKLSVVH